MSASNSNGVIRIDKKGIKKFAFGDSDAFDVDIVTAWQQWVIIDERFRPPEFDESGNRNEDRNIPNETTPEYYHAAKQFVVTLMGGNINNKGEISQITIAEALEFLARLREQWNDLVVFFRPKSRDERESPSTLEADSVELQFSEEPGTN